MFSFRTLLAISALVAVAASAGLGKSASVAYADSKSVQQLFEWLSIAVEKRNTPDFERYILDDFQLITPSAHTTMGKSVLMKMLLQSKLSSFQIDLSSLIETNGMISGNGLLTGNERKVDISFDLKRDSRNKAGLSLKSLTVSEDITLMN